jgi:hypothetical protein
MKIDKEKLNQIASLPDESLWQIIRALGVSSGIDLSGVSVSREQIAKIRSALGVVTDDDIARAKEIISDTNKK